MIKYFIYLKLRGYFIKKNGSFTAIINWGILALMIFYGYSIATFVKLSARIENFPFSSETQVIWVQSAIAILTIGRMFFPVYRPLAKGFPKYFPLSTRQQYLFSLLNDIVTPYFIGIILLLLAMHLSLKSSGQVLIQSLSILLSTHLIRRLVHYMLDYKLLPAGYLIILAHILAVLPVLLIYFTGEQIAYLMVPPYLLLIGYCIENLIINKKRQLEIAIREGFYLNLILRNAKVRPMVIGIFAVKIVIFLLDYLLFLKKGTHLFNITFVFWGLATPLVVFTYIFNNTWGYFPSVWINIALRSGDGRHMVWSAFLLMLTPMVIDFFITVPYLIFSFKNYSFILPFYFVSLLFLVSNSFFCSLFFPKKLNRFFDTNGNTSVISSAISCVGILLIFCIKLHPLLYFLIPIFLILSVVLWIITIRSYKTRKYEVTGVLV